jgi:hypothetical protein
MVQACSCLRCCLGLPGHAQLLQQCGVIVLGQEPGMYYDTTKANHTHLHDLQDSPTLCNVTQATTTNIKQQARLTCIAMLPALLSGASQAPLAAAAAQCHCSWPRTMHSAWHHQGQSHTVQPCTLQRYATHKTNHQTTGCLMTHLHVQCCQRCYGTSLQLLVLLFGAPRARPAAAAVRCHSRHPL